MASKSNVEFRVGIIILFGLIILLGSLYWLQGYKLERNATRIMVRFHDVGSLSVGDNVTVSGVHKGKVNRLTLTADGVLVELLIYKDVVLKRDAKITIRNLGLMGERFIAISPGVDTALYNPSAVADGLYDTGIPEVMGMMGEMVAELRNLVHSIKRTVGSDSSLDKFNNTVKNLEQVSKSLSSYMSRNEGKLDRTADNFLSASKELNSMLVRNTEIVDSSVDRISRVTVQVESLAGKLDSLAQSARRFADALDNENGTVRLLLDDRRLYDDLRRTANNLDELVSDIRANPRKYINLKVQLF
jgi:phospholipid/cholesterol/gamma-HCH transport system substrate-binding protein